MSALALDSPFTIYPDCLPPHRLAPSAEKVEIRKRILAAREALDPASRRELAARITSRLVALPEYCDARCVMAYAGFGTEFDTTTFIADLLGRRKSLVLPRVEQVTRTLGLHIVRDPERELTAGTWGIREPRPDLCPAADPAIVDFVLVPGVAFTMRCERLGYGGGFYDRLIRGFTDRPALVAAAFSLQVVPGLPVTASDQPVDVVATESTDYRRRA